MPDRAWDIPYQAPVQAYTDQPAPTLSETASAAFKQENSVSAAYDLITKPTFKPDYSFDLSGALAKDGITGDARAPYVGVLSAPEYAYRKSVVQNEQQQKDTLARSGAAGYALMMAAGTIDPINIIPFVGPGAKGFTAARMAADALIGTSLQEGMLYAAQETRSPQDAAFSIGTSAIIGAVLGRAAGFLSAGERQALTDGMDHALGAPAISSVGAAQVIPTDVGKFKGALGTEKVLGGFNPVTRGIQQEHAPVINGVKYESPTLRWATTQFSDSGLKSVGHSEGLVAAAGGNIEQSVKLHAVRTVEGYKAVDEAYFNYFFDGNVPAVGAGMRSMLPQAGKLTRDQFEAAISEKIWSGVDHPIAGINQAAHVIQDKIINPLFEEAKAVGVYKDIPKEFTLDAGYLSRKYDHVAVTANRSDLVQILANEFQKQMDARFADSLARLQKTQMNRQTMLELANATPEKIAEIKKGILKQAQDTVNTADTPIKDAYAQLTDLRRQFKSSDRAGRDKIKTQITTVKAMGGPALQKLLKDVAGIKARTRILNQTFVVAAERHAKKLELVGRNEEAAMETMVRAQRAAHTLISVLNKNTPAAAKRALKQVTAQFHEAARMYDALDVRLVKAAANEDNAFTNILARQDGFAAKMNAAAADIEELSKLDIKEWDAKIKEALSLVNDSYVDLIKRRGVREDRLLEQARALEPGKVQERLNTIKDKMKRSDARFMERFTGFKADNLSIKNGTADFTEVAKDTANAAVDHILKAGGRLPYNDIIRSARGPEIARTLNVPSMLIKDFLDKKVTHLVRDYVRTMGADIELARKFGSTNLQEVSTKLLEEQHQAIDEIAKLAKENPSFTKEMQQKAETAIGAFYKQAVDDLTTMLTRVRHERGIPTDPQAFATRALRLASNANVFRLMGGVLFSSASDPARPIMRYGLLTTFKDAFIPLINNFKTFKLAAKEIQLAGSALDVVLHSRGSVLFDVFDHNLRGNKLEKVAAFAAHKTGITGAFDYWTSAWKQFSSVLATGRILNSIETVLNNTGSERDLAKAVEFLAFRNIDQAAMERIWKEVNTGAGGGKYGNMWLPNTESWNTTDAGGQHALRAFRSALVGEVDDTITTPGIDLPSFMDSNIGMKALTQFKSFGMASTTRTLMAGLQERDTAFFTGVLVSLALGSLAYYLKAASMGGQAYTEMMNAPLSKWADEAISYSGVTGVFDEIQRIASSVPLTQPYASFSGTQGTRRPGGNLFSELGGPTVDLAQTLSDIFGHLHKMDRATVHKIRTLFPLQNNIALRKFFDGAENSLAAGLPGRAR